MQAGRGSATASENGGFRDGVAKPRAYSITTTCGGADGWAPVVTGV